MTQTAVMSAVFFTLFEFWKAQLKGPAARSADDRCAAPSCCAIGARSCREGLSQRSLVKGGSVEVNLSIGAPSCCAIGARLCREGLSQRSLVKRGSVEVN